MKSLNIKLALGAVAIALIATPAFAQRQHQRVQTQTEQLQDYAGSTAYQDSSELHYPNGSLNTGSLESQESGAQYNLGR